LIIDPSVFRPNKYRPTTIHILSVFRSILNAGEMHLLYREGKKVRRGYMANYSVLEKLYFKAIMKIIFYTVFLAFT